MIALASAAQISAKVKVMVNVIESDNVKCAFWNEIHWNMYYVSLAVCDFAKYSSFPKKTKNKTVYIFSEILHLKTRRTIAL